MPEKSLVFRGPCDSMERPSAPEGQSSEFGSDAQSMEQVTKPVAKQTAEIATILWTWNLRWKCEEREGVGPEGT